MRTFWTRFNAQGGVFDHHAFCEHDTAHVALVLVVTNAPKRCAFARVPHRVVIGDGHELVNQIRLIQVACNAAQLLVRGIPLIM